MKLIIMISALMIALCHGVDAQQAGADSTAFFKKQKKIAAIETRLADNKMKLIELEKSLLDKEAAVDRTLMESQQSANRNKDAADELQNNSDSKRASRRAGKTANEAKKDAKRARKAESRKNSQEKSIKSLQRKIEKDERELGKLQPEITS